MFNYYQIQGGEEPWQEALSDHIPALIASKHPRFVTVLAVNALISETSTREDIAELRYSGPLYFDWDGVDIETVLPHFKKFLSKLQELEVDLDSIKMFATGGRGFHVEIPQALFTAKLPAKGVQYLPAVYKELACSVELYTDTMDERVYSAKRGRMWRVTNSLRENGKYKVPLTVNEALNLTTAADYAVLCSAPRPVPPITPPTLNQKLAVLYAKAEQQVTNAVKRRGKSGTKDLELLARFKGQYPPSLLKVMAGEGTAEGLGFNQIAMQVAISTNALGKKEEEMLALCEGLIQNHISDGSRYNTPAKRRAELSHKFRYTSENPLYAYSRSAVRKLVPAEQAAPDLDGLPARLFMTEAGCTRRRKTGC